MKVEVYPSVLKGTIDAPGSKSIAQRYAACALLAKGETIIHRYPDSEDCKAALQIIQSLGAVVVNKEKSVHIKGGFPSAFQAGIRNPKNEINCGESGLSSRMFIPIAALHNQKIKISGSGSLLKRPFEEFEKVLPALGAAFTTKEGSLPAVVQGPLLGGKAETDGSLSSQYLTGLLMALPKAQKDTQLKVHDLSSKPYTEMTLEVMPHFGVNIQHQQFKEFKIKSGQSYSPQTCEVPGDWSGAAFILVAAAICCEKEPVTVQFLSRNITQADSQILDVLSLARIDHTIAENTVTIRRSEIEAFEFDATSCPDLIPPLVALAAFANGVSTIHGAERLIHKESNRAKVLQDEFGKANIRIVNRDGSLKVYPGSIRPAILLGHQDHRIVMAAALLGLGGDKITIRGAEAVSKSYPHFFDDLQTLGAKLHRT